MKIDQSLKFKVLHALASPFDIGQICKAAQVNRFLPFYHIVADQIPTHIAHLYTPKSVSEFEQEMLYFKSQASPVTLHELKEHIVSGSNKKVFHPSFDDGLIEVKQIIHPILSKLGIPYTIFVNTDFIDDAAIFYRFKVSILIDYLVTQNFDSLSVDGFKMSRAQGIALLKSIKHHDQEKIKQIALENNIDITPKRRIYLSKGDIIELLNDGVTLGSHTRNHPYLQSLEKEDFNRQIAQSFDYLEQEFSVKSKFFSFPFDAKGLDSKSMDTLHKEHSLDLSFGVQEFQKSSHKYHLNRLPMEHYATKPSKILKYALAKQTINKYF